MNYGMPYKGSKNKLAGQIFELFPRKKNFYDLFCGGCAMTHYGLLHGGFENYYMNDINSASPELFMDAVHGKFKDEKRWISHEDFKRLKDVEPYVAFCWSFGNNLRDYLYSKEIEPYKKACHYAIVFDDFSLIKELCPDVYDVTKEALNGIKDIQKRRVAFGQSVVKELKRLGDWNLIQNNPLYKSACCRCGKLDHLRTLQSLERLQSLENLERLQNLKRLESLQSFNKSYDEIEIKKDSVIYCDIPYEGTDEYLTDFDFEKFYSWCEKQTEPLFISSYKMPSDRFVCVAMFKHRCTLSATENIEVTEKVFIPKHQEKEYHLPGSLFNFDEMM